jgi:hypothetical protein
MKIIMLSLFTIAFIGTSLFYFLDKYTSIDGLIYGSMTCIIFAIFFAIEEIKDHIDNHKHR